MNRRILVLALGPSIVALLLLRPAPTTALEPSNASSVIELNSTFGSGTTHCPYGGVAADSVNKPDSTRSSGFTVPARRVLVLTDVEFSVIGGGPGNLITFTLARETSGAINWINSNGYFTNAAYYPGPQVIGFDYEYMAFIAGRWDLVFKGE